MAELVGVMTLQSPQQVAPTPVSPPSARAIGSPECLAAVAVDLPARCPRTMREYFRSRRWMPSESAIMELESAKVEIASLCIALSHACEWSMDWYASAPPSKEFSDWMSLLDADSRRLERFSRRDEACERIVAMFHIARILAQVPRLDTQREASRMGWQAIQRADAFLQNCDQHAALRIRDAAMAYATVEDASIARCVQTEHTRWITRPQERIRLGANGASLYLSALSEPAGIVTKSNEYPLSRLSGEELLVEMRAAETFFAAAAIAWRATDATAQLALLVTRAEAGEFGAWASAARPDFLGVRGELDRGRAQRNALCDAARVRGERLAPDALPAPPQG